MSEQYNDMLALVKMALRISGDAFDEELILLINSCLSEMRGLNVIAPPSSNAAYSSQIATAVIAYCKWQFGDNNNKEQFEAIYHTKLAQLKTMTNYTDWGVV